MFKKVFAIIVIIIFSIAANVFGSPQSYEAKKNYIHDCMIAYAADDGLYCIGIYDEKSVSLVYGQGISKPVFSRDGKTIAYIQNNNLYVYAFDTGKTRLVLEQADSYCPNKDGGFYASSKGSGITAINPMDFSLTTIISSERDTSFINLKVSPDFKYLAYESVVYGIDNQNKGGLWLYDVESGITQLILKSQKASNAEIGIRPTPCKWAPDSKSILIWLMSNSASLSSDGVGIAIYNITHEKLLTHAICCLPYDENITFATHGTFALVAGSGREMSSNKSLYYVDPSKNKTTYIINSKDMTVATPCYSSDGMLMAFSMSPAAKTDDNYNDKLSTLFKRQIYVHNGTELYPLTDDENYRSEYPVFLNDNKHIVFARLDLKNRFSIWIMDCDGKNIRKLACWTYKDPQDFRAVDFYGRIDWSAIFGVKTDGGM